jgi:hypothetical protein
MRSWKATYVDMKGETKTLSVEAADYASAQLLVMGLVPWIFVQRLEEQV